MGWFNDDGEDEDTGENGLLARLTGIPNTDGRGQDFALAAALANAGSAVANATRTGGDGSASTGSLLSAGIGGFTNGLGMQAMLQQKAAVDAAKRKMAEMQMRGMQQEQEAWQQANKAQQEGGQLEKLALLPGSVGAAVRQILQQRTEEQYRQIQLGLQRDANARGWAELKARQAAAEAGNWTIGIMDDKFGNKVPYELNTKTGEMRQVDAGGFFSQSGAGVPDPAASTAKFEAGKIYDSSGREVSLDPRMRWLKEEARTLPDGRKMTYLPDQTRQYSHITSLGDPLMDAQKTKNSTNALKKIAQAKQQVKDYIVIPNTGLGNAVPFVNSLPGSAAQDLQATLDTLGNQEFLENLLYLRQNSPSGAGVGNVSEKEGDRFERARFNLTRDQSEKALMRNLLEYEEAAMDIAYGTGNWSRDKDGNVLPKWQAAQSSSGRRPAQSSNDGWEDL
jgi:hypothetical protein